jgi:hypothetical protein
MVDTLKELNKKRDAALKLKMGMGVRQKPKKIDKAKFMDSKNKLLKALSDLKK